MALANYSDLKTSVANWLHRTDLTAQIPDFIVMLESRLNRIIDLRINETEIVLTATPNSRFINLPTDFIEPKALWLTTTTPRYKIVFVDPSDLYVGVGSGWPSRWSIVDSRISTDIAADQAHTFDFRYKKSFSLSDANPTNWLMTNHPDLYLFGTLLEATPYIRDDGRLAMWQERFDRALQEIEWKESRSKSLATLKNDDIVVNSSRNSGYSILDG